MDSSHADAPLSALMVRDLDEVWEQSPLSSGRWSDCAYALERLRAWSRLALAENHLVAVASHLHRKHRVPVDQLDALGVPADLLQQFPNWRAGSRAGFRARSSGLRSTHFGAHLPIEWLRIQLSPAPLTTPYALVLLRDLIRRLDATVRFMVIVEPGANIEGLRQVMRVFRPGAEQRVGFAELRSVTVFSQDNALAARDVDGNPALLIPRAFREHRDREEDALSVEEAQRAFDMPVFRSQLHWEGGNILHGADHRFIGADTIAENMRRLGLTRKEVTEMFAGEFGAEVITLGDVARARFGSDKWELSKSGQASLHVDLDVSLLGVIGPQRKPVAFIADPVLGLNLLPAVLSRRSLYVNSFLKPDRVRDAIRDGYHDYASERRPKLLAYRAVLEKLGYRVVGMPDLRINPDDNLFRPINLDFGYCNVLPGLRRARPAVYYLSWGIGALDDDARQRMGKAGVDPVRVSNPRVANLLMGLSGGLHCFCGPLR